MSERGSSNSSEALLKFLKERVEANQGIPLQKLVGHLSKLPYDLRAKYGCSVKSLKVFLREFPDVFFIRKKGKVYVRTKSIRETSSLNCSLGSSMTSMSDRHTDEDDVTCFDDVRGTVYRIFRLFGFISVKYPIKTSVFFDVTAFENGEHTSLPSSGLCVGDCVILDAKVGPKDCKARFRATRVARTSMPKPSSSPCLSLHSVSDGVEGDCNTITHLVNKHGVIETVNSRYGVIKFGRNLRKRAFFHVNNVDKSLGKSIKYLPNVLRVEDKVHFNARPSKKPSDKVKWEATTVYLYCSSDRNSACYSEGESGNEVFMSDDESDIENFLQAELDKYERREMDFNESAVGYTNGDASLVNGDSCNSSVERNRSARRRLSEWERRQKLSDERGCFYPVTGSVGKVKFGPGRGLVASAAVEVTYRQKERIHNLLREVADGQEVRFDAVQAEGNAWIATLVWMGPRPAKPLVDDSEDVFNRITNKIRGPQTPNAEPVPRGDFGADGTLQNVGPGSQPIQTSIFIYKDAKGVIVRITDCIGTCEVHEIAASRKIEFKIECFYKDGNVIVGDLNEVLREGDPVLLDYMVGVKGTKEEICCGVVWQGRRPSEVRQMSPEEFLQRLQMDSEDGNSIGFEDFEMEIARAGLASPAMSDRPSDTGLPDDTLPSIESAASSSVFVAGLFATWPLAASALAGMGSRGAHNESSACESSPGVCFLFAGVNDEVLHRLSKMVASEIIAEKRRQRVVVHDACVQTVDQDPRPSPPPGTMALSSLRS